MTKQDFSTRPEIITEPWCTWQGFMTAIPSLVFVVTGWKANGKENACLQSWASFVGGGIDEFVCILGAVSTSGHMYQSLKETGACVLNFPTYDIYERCIKTIGNNEYETDEITAAGLTAEPASKVNAPRIQECFLNIECEYLWEHKLFENTGFFGYDEVAVALKAVNICMDSDHYDQDKLGRYGKTGYLFQIDQPTNPETGQKSPIMAGTLEVRDSLPWETK
ncbi:MAG: flavin reductase [Coriobacteriia bacterium]|nr:flavin reductase [Coriobacteriia bacterium]